MKVLIACESSGEVRNAFRELGHDAWSCDLLSPDDNSKYHFKRNVLDIIKIKHWDLIIAHPPCTYLCSSGIHWLKERKKNSKEEKKRVEKRIKDQKNAIEFFTEFTKLECAWCIENPIGIMSTLYRKPDQYIQPYNFGHDASKKTCLWLNKLPLLKNGQYIQPREVVYKGKKVKRWSNQTDSGQNKLPPSKDRWKIRSKTYKGIAKAMAKQWNNF